MENSVRELKLVDEETRVFCTTEEQAKKVIEIGYEHGYGWSSGHAYHHTYWDGRQTEGRCYTFGYRSRHPNAITTVVGGRHDKIVEADDFIRANEEKNGFKVGDIVKAPRNGLTLQVTDLKGFREEHFTGKVLDNSSLPTGQVFNTCRYDSFELFEPVLAPLKKGDLITHKDYPYKIVWMIMKDPKLDCILKAIVVVCKQFPDNIGCTREDLVRSDFILINDMHLGLKINKDEN
jgi:hypothetical protein